MQRRRRALRWILGLGLFCSAIGLTVAFLPREPQLLKRATFIANTEPWYGGARFQVGIGIHWLSDEELLVCRFEGKDGHDRILYRHNIKTGREQKLPGLTQARDHLPAETVDDQCVSPDGRWFLCSARWDQCLLAEVNGTRYHLYDSADDSAYRSFRWMPDSRHWLEEYGDGGRTSHLILHDTEHPDFKEAIPVGKNGDVLVTLRAVISRQDAITLVDADPDTEDSPSSAVSPRTFILSRISLDAPASPRAQFRLTMPPGSSPYRVEVSPHGDRLAWCTTTLKADATRKWLHRFLPFLQAPTRPRTEIWTCDLNGDRMHLIGSLLLQPDDDSHPIGSLQWLPDGKHLSFEYRDHLYTVPAD